MTETGSQEQFVVDPARRLSWEEWKMQLISQESLIERAPTGDGTVERGPTGDVTVELF